MAGFNLLFENPMHLFHYVGNALHCEAVDLAAVARLHGTPTYVYSAGTMEANYRRLLGALPGLDVRLCYAMKANSSLAVLRQFGRLGAGFDLVSGGELRRVIAAGCDASGSVFAGVGKTEAEIRLALEAGIYGFHVESEPELARINHLAGQLGVTAPIAFRVNPDVDAGTHAKVTTGRSENKFGVPLAVAMQTYESAARFKNIEIRGVQMHIGSQITGVGPFAAAVGKLVPFAAELRDRFGIKYFSLGGGIGVVYQDALASGAAQWWETKPAAERPLTPEAYGAALAPVLRGLGLRILLEPGRFMVANAGVLLSRVEYVKRGHERNFLIVDAGFNDLMRPAMYDSFHEIVPLARDPSRTPMKADVVGPICESSDVFARERMVQQVGEGELLAFLSAGAYGFSMASRYNSRPLAAEVMVRGSSFELVTARESFEQMIANEKVPSFLV